jgi:hypothetical protein
MAVGLASSRVSADLQLRLIDVNQYLRSCESLCVSQCGGEHGIRVLNAAEQSKMHTCLLPSLLKPSTLPCAGFSCSR